MAMPTLSTDPKKGGKPSQESAMLASMHNLPRPFHHSDAENQHEDIEVSADTIANSNVAMPKSDAATTSVVTTGPPAVTVVEVSVSPDTIANSSVAMPTSLDPESDAATTPVVTTGPAVVEIPISTTNTTIGGHGNAAAMLNSTPSPPSAAIQTKATPSKIIATPAEQQASGSEMAKSRLSIHSVAPESQKDFPYAKQPWTIDKLTKFKNNKGNSVTTDAQAVLDRVALLLITLNEVENLASRCYLKPLDGYTKVLKYEHDADVEVNGRPYPVTYKYHIGQYGTCPVAIWNGTKVAVTSDPIKVAKIARGHFRKKAAVIVVGRLEEHMLKALQESGTSKEDLTDEKLYTSTSLFELFSSTDWSPPNEYLPPNYESVKVADEAIETTDKEIIGVYYFDNTTIAHKVINIYTPKEKTKRKDIQLFAVTSNGVRYAITAKGTGKIEKTQQLTAALVAIDSVHKVIVSQQVEEILQNGMDTQYFSDEQFNKKLENVKEEMNVPPSALKKVLLLLLTVTESENLAARYYLSPLNGKHLYKYQQCIDLDGHQHYSAEYHIGQYGKCPVAIRRVQPGAAVQGGTITAPMLAYKCFSNLCAIIGVGAVCGVSKKVGKLDVIVSEKVIDFTKLKAYNGGQVHVREALDASYHLLNLFQQKGGNWNPNELIQKAKEPLKMRFGVLINGSFLFGSTHVRRRQRLISHYAPEAVAIEMEGAYLFAATEGSSVETIVVKGVSGFGDKPVEKNYEPTAALLAVDCIYEVISKNEVPLILLEGKKTPPPPSDEIQKNISTTKQKESTEAEDGQTKSADTEGSWDVETVKGVYRNFTFRLVTILPIDDPLFIALLAEHNLFSGDVKEKVKKQDTRAEKAAVFLDKAITRPIGIGAFEPLKRLLLAMKNDEFNNEVLKALAAKIEKEINTKLEELNTAKATTPSDSLPEALLYEESPHLEGIKKVFDQYYMQLLRVLPMQDPFFLRALYHENILPNEMVKVQGTNARKAAQVFLDHILKAGDIKPIGKLLKIMERNPNLEEYAKSIKEEIAQLTWSSVTGHSERQAETPLKRSAFDDDKIFTPQPTEEFNRGQLWGSPTMLRRVGTAKAAFPQVSRITSGMVTPADSPHLRRRLSTPEPSPYLRAKFAKVPKEMTPQGYSTLLQKIQNNYPQLENIPARKLLANFFQKEVISHEEKKEIQKKSQDQDRMSYILDEILIPSLKAETIQKFKGFLSALEISGDSTVKSVAIRLGRSQDFP